MNNERGQAHLICFIGVILEFAMGLKEGAPDIIDGNNVDFAELIKQTSQENFYEIREFN